MSASRPLQARKDTQAEYNKQRREVLARDGPICRMERWSQALRKWSEHGIHGTDTAHIYPRNHCGGAYAHKDVALRACRECHDEYDGHGDKSFSVRVPPVREMLAFRIVSLASKIPVVRRKPPERPTV